MSKAPIPKYRPVLTATQIDTLLSLCKSCATLTPEVLSCISVLAPFQAKIQNAGLVPAYTEKPRTTIEEQLGFSELADRNYDTSPEQKRAAAHMKYKQSPASCTVEELELAHTYRYENGLMTPEEEIVFEGNMMRFNNKGVSDVN